MTRTLPQRHRTNWDWRLKVYPLIAAGLMVIVLNAAPRTTELPSFSEVESPSVTRSSVAAPIETVHGLTGKGSAYVLTRNPPCVPACPKPLVLEFTVKFAAPNTLID
jgi:hypothetical protein